jgi:hypothetical protein
MGMNEAKPFELRVIPRKGSAYGLELYQRHIRMNNTGRHKPVVRLWGTPLTAVMDQVLDTVRRNGYKATDLRAEQTAPLELAEEHGVRLGLLFLAVKPLKKITRIDDLIRGLKDLQPEETYYWYAKCSKSDAATRAARAFRILMADE